MDNFISLKKRSKSFFWASFFFSKNETDQINILYSFCRLIDDISDSNRFDKKTSKKILNKIKIEIINKKSNEITVKNFIKLIKFLNIDEKIPCELIDGVKSDLKKVNFTNIRELENYSYFVAGTVGLMMCSIMKVKKKSLYKHAIELGIAMQITNIARDLREDLDRARIYLPETFRSFKFKNVEELRNNKTKINLFCNDNVKLILYSDVVYSSARQGIYQLPMKHRIPIMLASNLYQEIGKKIIRNPINVWNTRVYVSFQKKILITIKTILICILPLHKKKNNI
ncbi:MAG: hypothetical protein CMM91_10855 [Rickettsiales bacterium]|nr:hypothetical protein [Rickettsiales bacterium]OUV52964.1 MAG: hypothetical protein CBC87_06340 [Rickettsiales bacterium TMED127]|tara:strand:+ start:62630 stop:63481 length:852 start_codon:yes stop_codon:yes gene_type:complete